jgi:DNA (cytosine-5)-methyltransferase 1
MEPGWQYPELYQMAEALFEKELPRMRKNGVKVPPAGTKAFAAFKARCVPPYDPTKFPNKWRKMEANKPARTLLAHLGKDSYTHIHYDSKQGRTISVREGARLQSFPDGFVLDGTINPAFKQIGNAVPALMSYAIAREVGAALGLPLPKDIRAGTLI